MTVSERPLVDAVDPALSVDAVTLRPCSDGCEDGRIDTGACGCSSSERPS